MSELRSAPMPLRDHEVGALFAGLEALAQHRG